MTSLLAEGLVARGSTSPCSPPSTRSPRPRSTGSARTATPRTPASTGGSGRRCTSPMPSRRSAEFDLVHNHLDWLPLALLGALPRAAADHDPRVLRSPDPACVPAQPLGVRVHLRRRPGRPTWTTAATVHHGIDLAVSPSPPPAATTWSSSAGSTPTRAPPTRSRSPGGPAGACHRRADPGRALLRPLRGASIDGDRVCYLDRSARRDARGARWRARAAAPDRLRRAVRAVRGRVDGLRAHL